MSDKRLEWSEAFAGYEREYDVIEAVRADYLAYVEQTLRRAREIVVARLGNGAATVGPDANQRPFLELRAPQPLTGLFVQAWPTRMGGGEPGGLRVVVWLRDACELAREAGPNSGDWRVQAALDALAGTPGKRFEPADCPELASDQEDPEDPMRALWVSTVPLDAADAPQRLAAALVDAQEGARRAGASLLRGRPGDVGLWARLRLLEARERARLAGKPEWSPKEGLSNEWGNQGIDARWLGLTVKADKYTYSLYVAVTREGDVRVVHDGGFERARKATIERKLEVSLDEELDDLPAGTFLKAQKVSAMMAGGQKDELAARLGGLFERFSALYV